MNLSVGASHPAPQEIAKPAAGNKGQGGSESFWMDLNNPQQRSIEKMRRLIDDYHQSLRPPRSGGL